MSSNLRPIPGLREGWVVSDVGHVYHHDAPVTIRKQNGYDVVTINATEFTGPPFTERTARYALVHELILLAFVGPRPAANYTARYIDNDRDNCQLTNLCWATYSRVRRDLGYAHPLLPITPRGLYLILEAQARGLTPHQLHSSRLPELEHLTLPQYTLLLKALTGALTTAHFDLTDRLP